MGGVALMCASRVVRFRIRSGDTGAHCQNQPEHEKGVPNHPHMDRDLKQLTEFWLFSASARANWP
eukprot:10766106-Alexandrium_andersonii.AAC.1